MNMTGSLSPSTGLDGRKKGTLSPLTELAVEVVDLPPFSIFLGGCECFIQDIKNMEKTIFQNSATALLESCTLFLLLEDCGTSWKLSSRSRSISLGEPSSSRCRLGMLAALYSRRIPLCVSSVTGRSSPLSIH
jgi:hypothetical protein